MELRQLKYFIRIVEMGSVSRASQALHVAQPALSAQLARLEDELGTRLLTRSVRGVTPTDAGRAVYEQARLILRQVDATQDIARQMGEAPTGPVAVGLPWTVSSVLGLGLLRQARATLPGVRLEITEGPSATLAQMLADGRLDLAVLFDHANDAGLAMRPVVEEPLLLVGAAGSLAGREGCDAAEAAALPLLLLSRPNGIRESLERLWAGLGVAPQVVAEINAPALLIDAVHAGLGYAIVPACALDRHLQDGTLDAVPFAGGALRRRVYLSTSRVYAPTRAAEHVHALVQQQMRDTVAQGRWQAEWVGGAAAPKAPDGMAA